MIRTFSGGSGYKVGDKAGSAGSGHGNMVAALTCSMEAAGLADESDEVKRDWHLLHQFELDLVKKQGPDLAENLRVLEAMYEEARHLGVFPLRDALEGIEIDFKIARVVNFVRNNTRKDSQGAH
jgi:hypothetical protein